MHTRVRVRTQAFLRTVESPVANPEWVPRGKKQAKRARGEATPAASESTESDEEGELCDECDEE